MSISVIPIKLADAEPWLLRKHYARRMCPVSYAFGAYESGALVGVVTFGVPISAPLRSGVCGPTYAAQVLELNRLCCNSSRNLASRLVGQSLRMLPKPSVVVSFADIAQGHIGYVYQACNFIYTGLSAKRTDWRVEGLDHLHSGTIVDMSYGQENRAEWMRAKFGDAFYLRERSRKHRYVFFCGNKKQKAEMHAELRYSQQPYPKGESKRYDAGGCVASQGVMFA